MKYTHQSTIDTLQGFATAIAWGGDTELSKKLMAIIGDALDDKSSKRHKARVTVMLAAEVATLLSVTAPEDFPEELRKMEPAAAHVFAMARHAEKATNDGDH